MCCRRLRLLTELFTAARPTAREHSIAEAVGISCGARGVAACSPARVQFGAAVPAGSTRRFVQSAVRLLSCSLRHFRLTGMMC